MSRLPRWLPSIISRIGWGCSTSGWLSDLSFDERALPTGKEICRDLWPFIAALPGNVAAVRDSLPAESGAARDLLSELADERRHYQNLFLAQCRLAGLSAGDLDARLANPTEATAALTAALSRHAQSEVYTDGIHAIVVAELAATAFCRAALPHYERYFTVHAAEHDAETIESGMAWLRYHAEQQTGHALLIKRMYADIEPPAGKSAPLPAEEILHCVFRLWRCPAEPGCADRVQVAQVR